VDTPDAVLEDAARLCLALGADGLRGELTLMRAARALAALEGADQTGRAQLRAVAPMALRHRLRRAPLEETGSQARIARVLEEVLG
jgi:magnesium chelatase subunit I